jgi:hypothetical protein
LTDLFWQVWDLLEGKHLFTERLPSREESSAAHLAKMVALLGPPPRDLLERSNVAEKFFNSDGKQHSQTWKLFANLLVRKFEERAEECGL